MLLDMQPKLLKTGTQSHQRDMDEKRALVDTMFKYLDVDQDGWLVSDELETVGVQVEQDLSCEDGQIVERRHLGKGGKFRLYVSK